MKAALASSQHYIPAQWVMLGMALLVTGALIAYSLVQEYHKIEILEQERLSTQARVADRTIAQQLEAVYRALLLAREEVPAWRTSGWQNANRHLKGLDDAMPAVRTILITDAHGTVQASDRKELIGKNFNYRDYFTVPSRQSDPKMLYLSPPFQTTFGIFTINATVIIPGPRGEFSGIISATIEPSYFEIVLSSVLYAPDMWSAMAHRDGIQFLMVPQQKGQIGKNLAEPGSFFSRHLGSNKDENVLTGTVYSTGDNRMMAIRTIRLRDVTMDKPLIVAIGRNIDAMHATWRQEVKVQGTLFGIIALSGVTGLYFYQRRRKLFDWQAAESLMALRQSEEKLQKIIDGSSAVIFAKDLDGRYLFINALYEKLFGISRSNVIGKTDYDIFPRDAADKFREADLRALQADMPVEVEETVPHQDGIHHYLASKFPLYDNDGNPYAVCGIATDITERRQRETEREMLIKELQENIAKVKILSGFLPICASCKKIRDDKGYWNQIEEYISTHSQAEFTHSICPDCTKILYPHYYNKMSRGEDTENK
ncbi:MAG: hypothetical protein C0402_05800 [Thermodesulfovibrio sp.]|nr:hypothetical protein [Thermodesulfovibrio sp.]